MEQKAKDKIHDLNKETIKPEISYNSYIYDKIKIIW